MDAVTFEQLHTLVHRRFQYFAHCHFE